MGRGNECKKVAGTKFRETGRKGLPKTPVFKAIGTVQGLGKPTGWAHLSKHEPGAKLRHQMSSSAVVQKGEWQPHRFMGSQSPEPLLPGAAPSHLQQNPTGSVPRKHQLLPRSLSCWLSSSHELTASLSHIPAASLLPILKTGGFGVRAVQ